MTRGRAIHRMRRVPQRRRFALLLFVVLGALSCGPQAPPPAAVVSAEKPKQEAVDPGPTSVESAIGGMNQEAVESAFKSMQKAIEACLADGSSRIETLGGHFMISVRVDRQGAAKWAYMKESTLGDRTTEACILGLVRERTWPKPLSGDGLVEKSFDMDPSIVPAPIDERKIKVVLTSIQKKSYKCRTGVRGPFVVTVYVTPSGRARGAGVALPSEKAEALADCLVAEVLKHKFAATGKQSKVSFELQ